MKALHAALAIAAALILHTFATPLPTTLEIAFPPGGGGAKPFPWKPTTAPPSKTDVTRTFFPTRFIPTTATTTPATTTTTTTTRKPSTCGPQPFSFLRPLNAIGCKSLRQAADYGVDAIKDALRANNPSKIDMQVPQLRVINDEVLTPLITGVIDTMTGVTASLQPAASILDSNICVGNFDDPSIFQRYKGVCQQLPLKGAWSVFGFTLDVGRGSPFNANCPTISDPLGTYASFCIALTVDPCSKIPSLALAVTPNLLQCSPFSGLLAAASAGSSLAVARAVDEAADSFVYGVSLTNDFVEDFKIYDGSAIVPAFNVRGTFYSAAYFSLDAESIGVPRFIGLSGSAARVTTIRGAPSAVRGVIDAMSSNAGKSATGVLKAVAGIKFSELFKMALYMTFDFSQLGKSSSGSSGSAGGSKSSDLALALPDSNPFEIGQASLFLTTHSVTSGDDTLQAGLYMYASASPFVVIEELMKYVLSFSGQILDALPWLPSGLDFNADSLVSKLDRGAATGGDFAIALSTLVHANGVKSILFLQVPLLVSQLGYIRIRCEIRFAQGDFKCSVKTRFNEKFFGAIAEHLADGILFVARELDSLADDAYDESKKLLVAGYSKAGDAATKYGSAFSKATVAETKELLRDGRLVLGRLGDAGLQIQGWALKGSSKIEDGVKDLSNDVATAVVNSAKAPVQRIRRELSAFKTADNTMRTAANAVYNTLQCTLSHTIMSVQGQRGHCTRGDGLVDRVRSSKGVVASIVDDVSKGVRETARKVSDAAKSVGKWVSTGIFGRGKDKHRKVTVRIERVATTVRHAETGCEQEMQRRVVQKQKKNCRLNKWLQERCGDWHNNGGETFENIGYSLKNANCIQDVAKHMVDAVSGADGVNAEKETAEKYGPYELPCESAVHMTGAQLVRMKCETTVDYDAAVVRGTGSRRRLELDVGVRCETPVVGTDGRVGGVVSKELTRIVGVGAGGVTTAEVTGLRWRVVELVRSEVMKTCLVPS